MNPSVKVINANVFEKNVIEELMQYKWDFIISNPDFSLAVQFLYIVQFLLAPNGICVCVLPSAFFDNSPRRLAFLKDSCLVIVHEFKLGRLSYRTDKRPKISPDSIFVFQAKSEANGELPKHISEFVKFDS